MIQQLLEFVSSLFVLEIVKDVHKNTENILSFKMRVLVLHSFCQNNLLRLK